MTSAVSASIHSGLLDTFNGLPAHPLIVHGAIGLVLVAALGGLLSLVPRWRTWMLPASAAVSVLAALSTIFATESGESLEHRVARSDLIEQHAEWGERTRTAAVVLAVLLVAWWAVERAMRRASAVPGRLRMGSLALGAATAVVAVIAAGALMVTGDQGAKAVWQNTPPASSSGEAASR